MITELILTYVRLIRKGALSIDDVPERYKPDVELLMNEDKK